MRHFVALPGKTGPRGTDVDQPEHIVSMVPKITRDGIQYSLRVEVKLVVTPPFDALLGDYSDVGRADAGWASFLQQLQELRPVPPADLAVFLPVPDHHGQGD
ncbi:MAG: hypothetical protein EPO52_06530 [Herbiconiux sp.]|uniref:hypothetical protein n=1 Tax=Herbiconiux sp. TaxID=1871186 RepID=UPI00121402B6|nr:hypothetical protein [Herbiconiux sp.]TAJ47854.1 MAG: hypothetical protein EPO52_06530 [Herbiconiux sp.]